MQLDADDSLQHGCLSERETVKKLLLPLAIDIVAGPYSEAFVERIYSLCGDFSSQQENVRLMPAIIEEKSLC